jgi:hypothetical protein
LKKIPAQDQFSMIRGPALLRDIRFQHFRVEMEEEEFFGPRELGYASCFRWRKVSFHLLAHWERAFQDEQIAVFGKKDDLIAKRRIPCVDNLLSFLGNKTIGEAQFCMEGGAGDDVKTTIAPLVLFFVMQFMNAKQWKRNIQPWMIGLLDFFQETTDARGTGYMEGGPMGQDVRMFSSKKEMYQIS